ncbi:hypothetical protein AAGS40_23245 [Paraburkholderia sp. PREW-6R]|uniref:hypothetical protein n=1 Tax=Paraburkholderia sp. PREW-6R TaxID=3141544 RepID=UPI0031F54024
MDFYPQSDPALLNPFSASSSEFAFTPDQLVVGGDVRTAEVMLTGGVAYNRGDLLAFTASTNTVAPATAADTARFICPFTITAAQASAQATGNYQMQVYCEGDFNELAVTMAGVPLSSADLLTAKGALNGAGNIRLRKMT